MLPHLRANLVLLVFTLVLSAVLYPLALLVVGQTIFHDKAQGSLILDKNGQVVGSRLIAQPFTDKDGNILEEYFQSRPSAASYNGAASGASNYGANNYSLRDRVARQLGPIVKYRSGPKKGQLAAPDIESWFQKDQFQGQPGIVAQWANQHGSLAQNWVTAHPDEVAQWLKDHPAIPEPKPEDLAVAFFVRFSSANPGTFPSIVEHKNSEGNTEKSIEPIKEGSDIQSAFFDLWRQDNPQADLEDVPADMVMTSGSGLDPHITLKNALFQLERVAGTWAKKTAGDEARMRREIEQLLNDKAVAPLGGMAGVPIVNVLEVNLSLRDRYGSLVVAEKK